MRPTVVPLSLGPRKTPDILIRRADRRAGIDARRLLAQLPVEQREVVILRYYHDLRETDVGEILGIPIGTVKSRMNTAMKKLSEIVENER